MQKIKVINLFLLIGLIFNSMALAQQDAQIFSSRNKATVQNSPRAFASFTIQQPMLITRINTYHWNNGKGTPGPGKIGIQGIGSWQAQGKPGMYNAPNAEWWAYPNVMLNPGTYTVTDSDSITWSHNMQSGGVGHFSVYGRPASHNTSTPTSGAGTPSIRVQSQRIAFGETVIVTYENLPGNSQDWISVTSASKPDNQYGKWTYTKGNKNGTFQVRDLPPGQYQARLYFNWPSGQFNVQGRYSFEVVERGSHTSPSMMQAPGTGAPSIRVQSPRIAFGETVIVTYQNLPGNSQDWISVTSASKPDNQYGKWTYTKGNKNGTFQVSGLAPGQYQARLYFNWPSGQFNVQGRYSFEVVQ